jgi:formate dehydrogenase maturation protein FdhE
MTKSIGPTYKARIDRAKTLKETYPFAAEILSFYQRICAVQSRVSDELHKLLPQRFEPLFESTLRDQISVDLPLPFLRESLEAIAVDAPRLLAEYCKDFLRRSERHWTGSLQRYVAQGGTDELTEDSREELLARIVIDPYAELLASRLSSPPQLVTGSLCPKCGGRPVAGVLRIEGDGGKRFLLCAFCATEWEFRRIYCAWCGEVREESLPVFVAEKFAHVRIEGCDTCRHFVRSVDLTKDGHAVPVVDDLAAIPLALWAEDSGYQRIHGNLLGT